MRSEQTMLDLILDTAREDDRIRAVVLSGSRTNPRVRRDPFQDFDVVYVVDDLGSFTADHDWIARFGPLLMLQMPETMLDPPPAADGTFAYLMQFADGNRVDLTLVPLANVPQLELDSLAVVLLDKDGRLPALPPPSDRDYLPQPPTPRAFADCCNEFWWVCPNVAKGLWRQEITYAKQMHDRYVRDQLLKMLGWYVGARTGFERGPGKLGKRLEQELEPELWALLLQTYSGADVEQAWDALFATCDLFRLTATRIARYFGLAYPERDDANVSAHLRRIRALPPDAAELY